MTPPSPSPDAARHVHDVVIVGGGLVGASLAIALDRLGLDVGLVEATPAAGLPAVFDERNLSFAEATVHALTALGVMGKLRAPTGAIERIHISRQGDFGRAVLRAGDYGRDDFGRVVVARDFGQALDARLVELTRLRRYRPLRFIGVDDDGLGASRALRVADEAGERLLHARLLVAADGSHSAVRSALGIGADRDRYGHTLFVTRLRSDRAPDGTAYERLTEHGPTALLPRGDRHFGLVHGVADAQADAVAAMDEAAFLAHAQRSFGWRAGRFAACGPRNAYPAARVLARRLVAPRAVLVGNAAQTIHPLGAQGFNLGLRDALTLAELIADGRRDDPAFDCGDAGMLARCVDRRADDRQRTLAFSDGLARLGSNPAPLARPLRGLGLLAIDRLPTLQSWLVGGALGYRGQVPALCRGEGAAA